MRAIFGSYLWVKVSAFGTFHMRLAIRALQCYVPKARPYARTFPTLIS